MSETDQLDIFWPPNVMFASHVSVACICNFSFDSTKGVPDGRALAIAVMRTFDLE